MSTVLWTTLSQAFRRTGLPLVSYYAVTLAVPLASGAAESGAVFVKHATTVLVVPPMAIVLACVVHYNVRRLFWQDSRGMVEGPAVRRRDL